MMAVLTERWRFLPNDGCFDLPYPHDDIAFFLHFAGRGAAPHKTEVTNRSYKQKLQTEVTKRRRHRHLLVTIPR
jgi:hypothetical protein